MNTRHIGKNLTAVSMGTILATFMALGPMASMARADEVIAADTATSVLAVPAHVPAALASKPRQVVVTNHGGRSVTLFAKGERIRRILSPGARPAVFSGLTPGRIYTVAIGGEPIGTVIALDAPLAASGLTVRSTVVPGTVTLSWRHTPTAATGGRLISYVVAARSRTAPAVTSTVVGSRQATLSGLDPTSLYTFSVTPRNSAGVGRASTAVMSRPLGSPPTTSTVDGTSSDPTPLTETPRASAPVSPPASAPTPPAPGPSTKTILQCPTGFTELASGLCQKSVPYTFTVKAYTYTWGVVGSHSVPDGYAANIGPLAQGPICPWGGTFDGVGLCVGATSHSVDDYGWIKDATPVGFTDDGTQWTKKDPLPDGYTDDGTQWVQIVPKESVVVPA